jgi:hypothetical protein
MPSQLGRERRDNRDLWDRFWRDRHGRIVIYQTPNLWLIGWAVLAFISLFSSNKLANIFWWASLILLAVWSLLEIFRGVNYFRRSFGVLVLLLIIAAALGLGLSSSSV